jgi:hypothetical protein
MTFLLRTMLLPRQKDGVMGGRGSQGRAWSLAWPGVVVPGLVGLWSGVAVAQIVPDATLGSEASVVSPGALATEQLIEGGRRGAMPFSIVLSSLMWAVVSGWILLIPMALRRF